MRWLVVGGAGYIGAHVVEALLGAGFRVAVLDDLSTGLRARLPSTVPLHIGTILDEEFVASVLEECDIKGVVHLAGKKQVAESMQNPLMYYRENVGGCERLLSAMRRVGVRRLVFSSSAAVYGSPSQSLVAEDGPLQPMNPYGFTKLACEHLISDLGDAEDLNWISLRYFNVAGCGRAMLADTGGSNLIPMIFDALANRRSPCVFGSDYRTPDGTCIRDFIHVEDLARAHVSAVEAQVRGPQRSAYNVGTGRGVSVLEVIDMISKISGILFDVQVLGRRAGDPAVVVADPRKIRAALGWFPRFGLRDMVESSWSGWKERSVRNSANECLDMRNEYVD